MGIQYQDDLFLPWEQARGSLIDQLQRLNTKLGRVGDTYQVGTVKVADLPITPPIGTLITVNDASNPALGQSVVGGASSVVQVFWDGKHWLVAAGGVPVPLPADFTINNPTTLRTLDASGGTLTDVKQVLGTLIADLIAAGILK